jgi:hypothetical protein
MRREIWFSVTTEAFSLFLVLQFLVTRVGITLASRSWHATPASVAGRDMLLTPVAAMGIGLILVWLSRFAGCSDVLDWPLVLICLLCAGTAAVSRAQVSDERVATVYGMKEGVKATCKNMVLT